VLAPEPEPELVLELELELVQVQVQVQVQEWARARVRVRVRVPVPALVWALGSACRRAQCQARRRRRLHRRRRRSAPRRPRLQSASYGRGWLGERGERDGAADVGSWRGSPVRVRQGRYVLSGNWHRYKTVRGSEVAADLSLLPALDTQLAASKRIKGLGKGAFSPPGRRYSAGAEPVEL